VRSKKSNVWVRPYRGNKFRVYFRVDLRREVTTRTRVVREAVEAFGEDLALRGRRPETVNQTTRRLRSVMADMLEAPLSSLTYPRCRDTYRALVASGTWAASTHQKALSDCKTWGMWAAHRDRGWIKVSPWTDVQPLGRKADNRDNALGVDAARAWDDTALAMLEAEDDRSLGALAALLTFRLGLRPHELVQIEQQDIDDGGTLLRVRGRRLKTAAARRRTDIPPALQPYLLRLCVGRKTNDLLFPHGAEWVSRQCKAVSIAAGVPLVAGARAMRHTYASVQARRGVSIDEISVSMGHADGGREALRSYIEPSAVVAAHVNKVAGLLGDGRAKRTKPASK
jgi:integrase